MPNERLRAALLERGLTPARLAEVVGVDAKTVERWITKDRVPYRRFRYAVASHLGLDETYLWPGALKDEQVTAASASEIITIYPHRYAVPRDLMGRLFSEAREQIGVLVYSGLFLAEDYGIHQILTDRAKAGVERASQAPLWHLRRTGGGEIANPRRHSLERVWEAANPRPPEA